MNAIYKLILRSGLICTVLVPSLRAQEAITDEADEKRVQYQLVLPDEKTPENVKPEEHNPFESESEAQNRLAPGDTEENRVRDKLLQLPVVGTKRMSDGRMRVLLGDIILETGGTVPPVLSEQLVELKVKNITTQYIELAWQEKRATGLPPKLMIIPINISPKVRYQMLGQTEEKGKSTRDTNATMDLPLRDLASQPQNAPPAALPAEPQPLRAEFVADDPASNMPLPSQRVTTGAPPVQSAAPPPPAAHPASTTSPPPSPAVESVLRMLFGNPTPAPK
ncbi:MAG: hypothetical protein ACKVY0_11755 [Prosthecobacter sp.]|uniref:hypothetical protein n=1 Tax=Prosthecobacter sp. TaxID=1965333 RepID=UPI0039017126